MILAPSSSAVMASTSQAANSLNYFPTPPWAYRALTREIMLRFPALLPLGSSVWEPACGAGHGAIPLSESHRVFATDVHDWGYGSVRDLDFSFCGTADAPFPIDWVITNPPFTLAEMFLRRGLEVATKGVALLVRLQWLEGVDRYHQIFNAEGDARPVLICPFAERVPMIEGCWDPEAKSATAYCWIIWRRDRPHGVPMQTVHIPPGMALRHTRPTDEALASRGEAARRLAARKAA